MGLAAAWVSLVTLVVLAAPAQCQNRTSFATRFGPVDQTFESRIVGGTKVKEGQLRWVASLQDGWSHYCGGSLISPTAVLTAAHCVKGMPLPEKVVLGTTNLNKSGITRKAKKAKCHKRYNEWTVENDICVIFLSAPVLDVAPARIASPGTPKENPGTRARSAGWGATRMGGWVQTDMRSVDVPVVSHQVCTKPQSYPGMIDWESMICAGYRQGKKDSCQGDSGGPLFVGNVVIGVTSWGDGCAKKNKYGVYARVSSYSETWIRSIVKDLPAAGAKPVPTATPTTIAPTTAAPTLDLEEETAFCQTLSNHRRCRSKKGRCVWKKSQDECVSKLADHPLYSRAPTISPTTREHFCRFLNSKKKCRKAPNKCSWNGKKRICREK